MHGTTTNRPCVLVVDDDLDIRDALSDFLEDRGFDVTTAVDGAEALRLLGDGTVRPSLLLLDLMMPRVDGYEVVERLRRDDALAGLQVAVISASHGIDRARLGDDVHVIRKPIHLPALISTIEGLQRTGGR